MKNIVICCDGTWNTPDQQDRGVPAPTNVVRIFNAIRARADDGAEQRKYYHPGVGVDGSWWERTVKGGTGQGLDRNIMSAYRWLCDNYAAGDRIYLFGFSRGAYTVRSLVGFMACCGLLHTAGLGEAEAWQKVEQLFKRGYRSKIETGEVWRQLGWRFHGEHGGAAIPIYFLGAWDTVGALGIPDELALLNLIDNPRDHSFHDTVLSKQVLTARHAVALDELRASFQPTLWSAAPDQDAREMWFPGVHADVGGGYYESGLANGALKWMIDEAAKCKLAFSDNMVRQVQPDIHDIMHDSHTGVFSMLPTQPRSAPQLIGGDAIHPSALERQGNPPIHQCPYREIKDCPTKAPLSIDIFAQQKWNATGVWLEKGKTYTFSAEGEWLDASIKCGPDGTSDGHFSAGELAHVAGTALGEVEKLFTKLTGNQSADFRFTRRHEDMPWFCLVGSIANGGGADAKGYVRPHESFKIGTGLRYSPRESGYLYAYANDAWNCYGNNRGRVQLRIS